MSKWKKNLAILGLLLLSSGTSFILSDKFKSSYKFRESHETFPVRWKIPPPQTFEGSGGGLLYCSVNVDKGGTRILKTHESSILKTHVQTTGGADCETDISIAAPNFVVEPKSKSFRLPDTIGSVEQDFAFALSPNEPGTQGIVVTYDRGQDILIYSVGKYKYVPAALTGLVSPVMSVMGGMLTIPWWIECVNRFLERKKKDKDKKDKDEPKIILSS